MAYLLTQILFCLVLAALFGGAVGWIVNGWRAARREEALRVELLKQSLALNQAETDNSMIEDDFRELKYRSEEAVALLREETAQVPVLQQNLEKSQLLVRQLIQKHEADIRQIEHDKDVLLVRNRELENRESAVTRLQADLNQQRLMLSSELVAKEASDAASRLASSTGSLDSATEIPEENTTQSASDEQATSDVSTSGTQNPLSNAEDFGITDVDDDLQSIYGIGPVAATKLKSLGITSFEQIARFTRQDIEYIADVLGIFPGRIETDDWVGSAKKRIDRESDDSGDRSAADSERVPVGTTVELALDND